MLKVALIAPASEYEGEDLSASRQLLAKYSIELVNLCALGPVRSFEEAFLNDDYAAILCYRGGFGSCKMSDEVNWSALKGKNKPFLGYSDLSILLNRINTELSITTYHAPVLKQITTLIEDDLKSFINAIKNTPSLEIFSSNNSDKLLSGEIIGGNLTVLASIIGSNDEIKTDDKILFLEDVNEKLYQIERCLWQLKRAKHLANIKALLLGEFTFDNEYSQDFQDSVYELACNILPNITIINRIKAGHGQRNLTLPFGLAVNIHY